MKTKSSWMVVGMKTIGVFFCALVAAVAVAFLLGAVTGSQGMASSAISISPVIAIGAAVSYFKSRPGKQG